MINIKYENIYNSFLENYEQVHINPWHNISKEEVNAIYNKLINEMDVNDEISFSYFMNYIIKRLNGLTDAHTAFNVRFSLPLDFRIIDEKVFITKPKQYKKFELLTINNIDINAIINELDDVISYGTYGGKILFSEMALSNRTKLLGLPSLRNSSELEFKIKSLSGEIETLSFDANENTLYHLEEDPDNNCTFKIINNSVVYTYNSCLSQYEQKVLDSIELLKKCDLTNIDSFIIDLRNNLGGNDLVIKPLLKFIKELNIDILILTNYCIFSSGRFAIQDFKNIGGITIGEEIGTPTNCYGNVEKIKIDNYYFRISNKYFNLDKKLYLNNKEDFKKLVSQELESDLDIFEPNIYIKYSIQDFLNDYDPILNYALDYKKNKQKKNL